jgi:hypothetical protein
VHRQEIYDEIQRSNQAALTRGKPESARLPSLKIVPNSPTTASNEPKTGGGSG